MNDKKLFLKTTALIVICFSIGFSAASSVDRVKINKQNEILATIGKLSLSQSELINTVKSAKLTVYWAGPMAGYSYSLFTDNAGATVVRYLAKEKDLAAASNSTRMVATYVSTDAFSQSLTEASKKGNISFINSDETLVFYRAKNTNDVFIAFPTKSVQVEIFDPQAGQALSLAVLVGQITQIGA